MATPRRLLARLRELMAHGAAPLPELVRLVAAELVSEVCSVYAARPGEILELAATEGLNPEAVGRTRLRVGEGIVGLCAATAQVMNLPDAQNHPAFAYRPETGEEPFASMLAVPVRRAGRTLGVVAVQNRNPRRYADDEVDELETVAMLLAEVLAASGASDGAQEGVGATVPRVFAGATLVAGIAIGPVVLHGSRRRLQRLLADDPAAELARLHDAARRMQQRPRRADRRCAGRPGDRRGRLASREVLEAYRLVAADAGWLQRVAEVIRSGLSAEAAVQRVAGELHDRMRRITDPYLRERLADLEDLAGRLLAALAGDAPRPAMPPGAILLARRLGPAELLDWHAAASPAWRSRRPARPATPRSWRARWASRRSAARAACWRRRSRATRRWWTPTRGSSCCAPRPRCGRPMSVPWRRRSALEAGWAALREPAGDHRRRHPGQPDAECRPQHGTGAARHHRRRRHRPVPHRDRHAGARRRSPTWRSRRRSMRACWMPPPGGRCCSARSIWARDKLLPGDAPEEENPAMGWRSLAHRAGPAGAAAPAVARPAAGGGRAAAVGDVSRWWRRWRSSAPRGRCCWPRRGGSGPRRNGSRSAPCWRCRR